MSSGSTHVPVNDMIPFFLAFVFVLAILEIQPKALHMLGKPSTTELHTQQFHSSL
jgi:hypothetical protein